MIEKTERWSCMTAREIADDLVAGEAADYASAYDYASANATRENLRKAIEDALESYAMSCNENAIHD